MRVPPMGVAVVAAAQLFAPAVGEPPEMCLIVYQMADNNLERFIRDDNLELIRSCAIKKPTLHTWVYFDGRNPIGDFWEDINEPLEDVYNRDGSRIAGDNHDGSQYLTYDHSLSKMVVDLRLQGEQNGDSPDTVRSFVSHALRDCVARGATQYIAVFSSHGGGFGGFGGDEHPYRRYLSLMQSNVSILGALKAALAEVDSAPDKFDAIGFDACLMSSVSALAVYAEISEYYIASEATEPGHGWAYRRLCDVDSALDLLRDIHKNFLQQRQGFFHQSPKTLAIVDSAKFYTFHDAFEALAAELGSLLRDDDDPDFFALLQRSRAATMAFESILDNPGSETASAIDVGSFLQSLDGQCNPKQGTALRARLDEARGAYDGMFVERGNGPGTKESTGVHAMWPFKKWYREYPLVFQMYLFGDPDVAGTAPEWFGFVETYLTSTTPTDTGGNLKTCSKNAISIIAPTRKGQLLLDPEMTETDGSATVRSDLTPETDYVFVEFGIDAKPWLDALRGGRGRGRGLSSAAAGVRVRPLQRRVESSRTGTVTPPASAARRGRAGGGGGGAPERMWSHHLGRRAAGRGGAGDGGRRTAEEDYLTAYGGSVEGAYDGSAFSAVWRKFFFALGDDESFTTVYAFDEGNGAISIPVMYFPEGITVDSTMFSYDTTLDDAKKMGGVHGALEVGVDLDAFEITTAFTLITNNGADIDSTISETPPSRGGSIVPIIFVDGMVQGKAYADILGGRDGRVIEWGEQNEISLYVLRMEGLAALLGINSTSALIDMYAFDFDLVDLDNPVIGEGADVARFEVGIDTSKGSDMIPKPDNTTQTPDNTTPTPDINMPASASHPLLKGPFFIKSLCMGAAAIISSFF